MKRTVPAGLIDAINAGTCVAFVGAGFSSAAGLPPWKKLLRSLAAADVGPDLRHFVEKVTGSEQSSAHDLDRAAQLLSDHLGRPRFITGLKEQLVPSSLPPEMQQRLDWLHAIPFRAILTLNFDGVMKGAAAGSDAYLRILRRVRSHWWEEAFWSEGGSGPPTIKLHGDLLSSEEAERVVFTREDYRRRLYGDPSYATFLRAVFSTSTLLFLGVSFQDAYLNELRSEVLAMLGYDGQQHRGPVAYALLSDVDPAVVDHYHKHEGCGSSTTPRNESAKSHIRMTKKGRSGYV